jgi:hypothetical protein
MWPLLRAITLVIAVASTNVQAAAQNGARNPELDAYLTDGRIVSGLPVVWNSAQSILLESDGKLNFLTPDLIDTHRVSQRPFKSISTRTLERELQREFGGNYEARSIRPYVVIAPLGNATKWARRFDAMKHSFTKYFSTRKRHLQPVAFPLVAIVFATQTEFLNHCESQGMSVDPNTLGLYSPKSNRIFLFENEAAGSAVWHQTQRTIMHEAVHQLSFNTGLHNRLNQTPAWVAEGLATVFEAPGFVDTTSRERINEARLARWKKLIATPTVVAEQLQSMVQSDDLFRSNPDAAYAIAWAVSYYLGERDNQRYFEYLDHLSGQGQGSIESPQDRLRNFHRYISDDIPLLVQRVNRYLRTSD